MIIRKVISRSQWKRVLDRSPCGQVKSAIIEKFMAGGEAASVSEPPSLSIHN